MISQISKHEKDIKEWAEKQELNLNTKQEKVLVNTATWQKQLAILKTAEVLLSAFGDKIYDDFNVFASEVDDVLKAKNIKLSASEKNAILNAVSWYNEEAELVKKSIVKLTGEKLSDVLVRLGFKKEQLADYGFYLTDKKGEYQTYR